MNNSTDAVELHINGTYRLTNDTYMINYWYKIIYKILFDVMFEHSITISDYFSLMHKSSNWM